MIDAQLSSTNVSPGPVSSATAHQRWREAVEVLTPAFRDRARETDRTGRFVERNYRELTAFEVFSAGVPAELGGGNATHSELCELLRGLARACPSTALALSMHTHLVAASVWKWQHKGESRPLLEKVAQKQAVLVSTGATDWVESNGEVEKVPDGYLVSARKVFASGCPAASLLVTSAPYVDPEEGPVVLHFPVPFSAEGVSVVNDWDALGMRGTGSHSVVLDKVFVPEPAIVLRRPRFVWPAALNLVASVALPLIMSVYVGVAEEIADRVVERVKGQTANPDLPTQVGQMQTSLHTARLAVADQIATVADYAFVPTVETADRAFRNKTIATKALLKMSDEAMELAGGAGFYRRFGLEQLVRDLRASPYHPLPETRQLRFTGQVAMGWDPS